MNLSALSQGGLAFAVLGFWVWGLAGCSLGAQSVFDPDGDGVLSGADCDDADPTVGARYEDNDEDGFGSTIALLAAEGEDCSSLKGASSSDDCDDSDSDVHPGAQEVCNGADDDCNLLIDDQAVDTITVYLDSDVDGYGTDTTSLQACPDDIPAGFVGNADDCNDMNRNVNPEQVEVCDAVDQDCDGQVDEAPKDGDTYYPDSDGDGFGSGTKSTRFCANAVPAHYADNNDDCDDNASNVYPQATEYCDEKDNDCDLAIDDSPADGTLYFVDADSDGYGDAASTVTACGVSAGVSATSGDCNDGDASTYPGAEELCNGLDEDCDGTPDDGLEDWDGSGYPDCTEVAYVVSVGFAENGEGQVCGDSNNLAAQEAQVASVLADLGLHLVRFTDDHTTGLDGIALAHYPLVMYDDGGWTDSPLPASVTVLQSLQSAGTSLLFMGDDLVTQGFAYVQNESSTDFYNLIWISQWKAGGTTQRGGVVLNVEHPVLDGPAGQVQDFAYFGDMDVSIPAGSGEVVLANIFGSQNPAVLAVEHPKGRTVVMLPSSYATVVNCPVSDTDGLKQLRTLLTNAVSWLMYRDSLVTH